MAKRDSNKENKSKIEDFNLTEEQRLRRDIYRPDAEKLHLFTQMLRLNKLFNKARITHK